MEHEMETEYDLMEILMAVVRKIGIVIVSAIIGGLCFGLVSYYLIDPTYESNSTIYIVGGSENQMVDFTSLQISSNLTGDYTALVKKRPIVEEVIDNLKLDMTYDELVSNVTATNEDDTRMVNISVKGNDPDFTKNVANEFSKIIRDQVPSLMKTTAPTIVEKAVDGEKTGPNNIKNTLLGCVLGFVLSVGIIVFLYVKDDSIKNADDVEKYLGLNNLASIPADGGTDNEEKKAKKHSSQKKTGGK